jgi:predicted RNase H-like HicB family nuclease
MRIVSVIGALIIGIAAIALSTIYSMGLGLFGSHEDPGRPGLTPRPAASVGAESLAVESAASGVGLAKRKQILFGDLHVHTTFSFDAFLFSLPVMGGEGAHPPADACDFARYCSALDFWSLNDHDVGLTPAHWQESAEAIRQCNAASGNSGAPDSVAFLGWEWTQVGLTPEKHFGHKNVILRETDPEQIPARPIGSSRAEFAGPSPLARGWLGVTGGSRMRDFARFLTERQRTPACAEGVHTRDLPPDCNETAETPAELFRKLDEWGGEALVIPHGTTWGFYTPPGSAWDKQLVGANHDPDRQSLIEVYSGHGDSELYRDWREVLVAEDGTLSCPEPRPDYEPTCWRAGEIIRARCAAAGESAAECESRAAEARANAVAAGVAVRQTIPGVRSEDFLDAGQCRDCREPSMNYRPRSSAQYILALGNADEPDERGRPRRFRFGFMASSDNHFARPGTGYKQTHRRGMTESGADIDPTHPLARLFNPPPEDPEPRSRAFVPEVTGFQIFETERQTSFLSTGGLVAAHSAGRDRDSIWDSLSRREVYGTTGQRTLLWFDLLNAPGARGAVTPMGSVTPMSDEPVFQVRAVGSFEQRPGCPSYASDALGAERLQRVCLGECYHPSDRRRRITRIEIVRIRPQLSSDEPIAHLIDDPWRRFDCPADPAGCAFTTSDPDYAALGRDALYYARVFEEPELAINAANLRCDRDESGHCTKVHLCGRKDPDELCLAPREPRAWSSPIFLERPN